MIFGLGHVSYSFLHDYHYYHYHTATTTIASIRTGRGVSTDWKDLKTDFGILGRLCRVSSSMVAMHNGRSPNGGWGLGGSAAAVSSQQSAFPFPQNGYLGSLLLFCYSYVILTRSIHDLLMSFTQHRAVLSPSCRSLQLLHILFATRLRGLGQLSSLGAREKFASSAESRFG